VSAKGRELHKKLGQENDWRRYVTGLRERHRGPRALQEELRKARLRAVGGPPVR
jgi:hypothetical protein